MFILIRLAFMFSCRGFPESSAIMNSVYCLGIVVELIITQLSTLILLSWEFYRVALTDVSATLHDMLMGCSINSWIAFLSFLSFCATCKNSQTYKTQKNHERIAQKWWTRKISANRNPFDYLNICSLSDKRRGGYGSQITQLLTIPRCQL